MSSSWSDALDDFEGHLHHVRSVLERDEAPIETTDWPPADLRRQPVPAELVPRARALLVQAAALEAELEARREAIRVRTGHGPRHRPFLGRPSRSTRL